MKRLSDLPARDLELLSSYLDDELNARQKGKLLKRLEREPDLRWALDELRRTVSVVRSLPEVRPPRSFVLTPERAGIRVRPPAYPLLQLATALATLAFVAVVGLDALTSQGRIAALAPAPEQAERFAAQQAEEPAAAAPSEAVPSLGKAQTQEPLESLGQAPETTPTPQSTEGLGGGEPPATLPGASEALPSAQAEDRSLIAPGTPCIGCGGGGGEGEATPGEPPAIALAPPQATPTPTPAPTETTIANAGGPPTGGEPSNTPAALSQPSTGYRAGVPLVRLAEISLGLAVAIMAGLTLWVRRRG
jgi:hypothetical protein